MAACPWPTSPPPTRGPIGTLSAAKCSWSRNAVRRKWGVGKLKHNATYFAQSRECCGSCGADPLVCAGRPRPAARNSDISIVQRANRPTGASAADQGVRPTIRAEWPPGSKVSDIELKHAPPLQLVCLQRWGGLQL